MYVKLSPEDLNPGLCLPYPTSTYTYGVTIASRVCGDHNGCMGHNGSAISMHLSNNKSKSMLTLI